MKLFQWAQVAEIISSLVVVVSLLVLILEIQQNTEALRSSTYDSIASEMIDWHFEMAKNPEARAVFLKTQQGGLEALEPEELLLARNATTAIWLIYERAFYARDYHKLGDAEWSRFHERICRPKDQFWPFVEGTLTEEFVEYADRCRDGLIPPDE